MRLGTEGNGEGRGFTRFLHDPLDPESLGGNCVMDILRDRTGRLWVGSQTGGGLSFYANGKFQVFRNERNDPDSIVPSDVWSLYEDRSGLIWIGTAGGGPNQLNPSTHRIPLGPSAVRASLVDSDGVFWMGGGTCRRCASRISKWRGDRRPGSCSRRAMNSTSSSARTRCRSPSRRWISIAEDHELLYRRGNFNGSWDQLIVEALLQVKDAELAFSRGFRWGTTLCRAR